MAGDLPARLCAVLGHRDPAVVAEGQRQGGGARRSASGAVRRSLRGRGQRQRLVHDNQPLWYFPFLTTSVLAGWACIRLGRWGWAAALAYAGFALFHDGPRLPWALDIAGIGTLAFVCGHALRQHYDRVRPWLEHRGAALGLALAAAAVLVPAVHLNGSANLNGMEYGRNGALYLIAMLAGIGMILGLSAALPVTRLARVISVDTLTIFALHIYLLRVFSKLASTVAPLPASPAAQTAVMLGDLRPVAGRLPCPRPAAAPAARPGRPAPQTALPVPAAGGLTPALARLQCPLGRRGRCGAGDASRNGVAMCEISCLG